MTATDGFALQGTVAFYEGSTLLGIATIENGQAHWTTGVLPAGNHTFTAVYSGDNKHDISVGATILNT